MSSGSIRHPSGPAVACQTSSKPSSGLGDVARRLVTPTPEEGFDEIWHATAGPDGWRIEPLLTTPPLF